MLPGGLTQKITVNTKDSKIADQTATSILTILHDIPEDGANLRIDVSGGTNNSGSVIINGYVDSLAVEETVNFTAARWKITSNTWDAGALSITTTGFVDESVVPTIVITVCDVAGNPVEWTVEQTFPARIRYVRAQGLALLLDVKQAGIATPGMWEVLVGGSPDEIDEGVEFTISKMKGVYVVYGQVQEHMQLNTNMVDFVRFYAVKRSD